MQEAVKPFRAASKKRAARNFLKEAWLAGAGGMGPRGVYLAVPVAESLLAIASMVLFRRGRWKRVKI